MILTLNYCRERVQRHRIDFGIQYHDLRTSIGTYIAGKRKKIVKKDPKCTFSDLFGGGLLELVYTVRYLHYFFLFKKLV